MIGGDQQLRCVLSRPVMSHSRAGIHHDGSAFTSTAMFWTDTIQWRKLESQTPLVKFFYPEVTHSPFLLSLCWSKWVTWPCQVIGNTVFLHDLMRRDSWDWRCLLSKNHDSIRQTRVSSHLGKNKILVNSSNVYHTHHARYLRLSEPQWLCVTNKILLPQAGCDG